MFEPQPMRTILHAQQSGCYMTQQPAQQKKQQKEPQQILGVAALLCILLLSACSERAATSTATTLSSLSSAGVPGDDAPQLAHLGPYRVGVRSLNFSYDNADDISVLSHITGTPAKWTRRLSVDVLYPANLTDDVAADAIYHGYYETGFTEVDGLPRDFQIKGLAVRNAEPVSGKQFPLIVVSHGLLNTPGVLSGITENLANALNTLDASLMITCSRRTGLENQAILETNLKNDTNYFWNGKDENPYMAFLGYADYILVTADSASMISESCTTGKPVYMIDLDGGAKRIKTLHSNLIKHGCLKKFDGILENYNYEPLNDATLVANEIKKRFGALLIDTNS